MYYDWYDFILAIYKPVMALLMIFCLGCGVFFFIRGKLDPDHPGQEGGIGTLLTFISLAIYIYIRVFQ